METDAPLQRGLADVLLDIYHAAYCAGANIPTEAPADRHLRDLLSTLAGRHRAEILIPRGWAEPPLTADELPGWLLTLPQQAAIEREVALGDAAPPAGFETAPLRGAP